MPDAPLVMDKCGWLMPLPQQPSPSWSDGHGFLPSNVISLRIFANSFGSDVEAQISEQNATNDRTEFLQTTEQNHHKQPNKITTNNRKTIEEFV